MIAIADVHLLPKAISGTSKYNSTTERRRRLFSFTGTHYDSPSRMNNTCDYIDIQLKARSILMTQLLHITYFVLDIGVVLELLPGLN